MRLLVYDVVIPWSDSTLLPCTNSCSDFIWLGIHAFDFNTSLSTLSHCNVKQHGRIQMRQLGETVCLICLLFTHIHLRHEDFEIFAYLGFVSMIKPIDIVLDFFPSFICIFHLSLPLLPKFDDRNESNAILLYIFMNALKSNQQAINLQ